MFYNFSYKDNNNTGFNITMSSYTLKHSQNLTVTISNVLKNCLATKMKCQRPSRLLEVCWTFLKKNIIKGNSITSIALVKPYFSKLHIRIVVHDDILMNIYSAT